MNQPLKSTNERGYNARHQAERTKWKRRLNQGPIQCACERNDCTKHNDQCATLITATSAWDLGHTDDRTTWTGPECIPCNRGAGGRNGSKTVNERRATTIRQW